MKAIEASGGDIKAAAKLMGIGKTTAYRKARQFGISPQRFLGALICTEGPFPPERRSKARF